MRDIQRFHAEHRDIILKPLDGMGGMGIFRVRAGRPQPGQHHRTTQPRRRPKSDGAKFLPEIAQGRQTCSSSWWQPGLLPGAHTAGLQKYAGNLAAGGKGVQRRCPARLGNRQRPGPHLESARSAVGRVDVIGDCVTESTSSPPPASRKSSNKPDSMWRPCLSMRWRPAEKRAMSVMGKTSQLAVITVAGFAA